MARNSTVKVSYLGDASQLARVSQQARRSIDSVDVQAKKSSKGITGSFKSMGAGAKAGLAGLIGTSAVAGGKAIFDLAANMELMDQKAQTVFGGQLSVVKKWAKANANAMGLTSKEATGLAANFADLLIPMGFTREAAAKMSTDVVGLSGALARWSGGKRTAAEVSEILAKAMLGERDGLKELGISISDADVKQRLLKNGTNQLTGAALEQAKAEATQQLIMEKSTDAQAAYAKGANTLAARKAVLTAKIKELRDKAIGALIPKLIQLGNWINTNIVPAVKRLVVQFQSGTGAGGKLRDHMDRLKRTFEENRPTIMRVLNALKTLIGFMVTKVFPVVSKFATAILGNSLKMLGRWFDAFDKIKGVVQGVVDKIQDLIEKMKNLPGAGIAGKVAGKAGSLLGFADGTMNAPKGLAVVGEEGPELVNFRGGEQVIPNGGSRRGSRGIAGTNQPLVVNLVLDGRVVHTSLLRLKRTSGGSLGLA